MASQTTETTQVLTWPVWHRRLENTLSAVGAGVYYSEAHHYYLDNFTVREAADSILTHRRGLEYSGDSDTDHVSHMDGFTP